MQPKKNIILRIGYLFANPAQFFTYVKEKPDFFWPLLLILIYTIVSGPNGAFFQEALQSHFGVEIPQGEADTIINGIILVLTSLIYWVLRTGGYSLLIRMAGGRKVKAKVIFSLTGYFIVPNVLAMALTSLVLKLTGEMIPLGLESVLPLDERLFTLYGMVLASITPFTIAYVALASTAIRKVFDFTWKRAVTVTLVYWMIATTLQIMYTYTLIQSVAK